jgi:hypothetical protein
MAKFNGAPSRQRPVTEVISSALTGEGGVGVKYDARTELWNLTTAAMVGGEKSFYEDGQIRDHRLVTLTRAIIAQDGGFEWLCRFVPFLRREMFMRTAPVMIAAEAAKGRQELVRSGMAPHVDSDYTVRRLVASAVKRADEFGEFVGYWRMRFGRAIPGGVQRGLADRLVEVLNEYNAMKYDGISNAYRIGDVLNIVHPEPKEAWQSDLFKFLLDRRHHKDSRVGLERLPKIRARLALEAMPLDERRQMATRPDFVQIISEAGMTWENLAGWLERSLYATDWEAMIPSMGYMALLRNLRNFDQAGISTPAAAQVAARLADPDQVKMSMQFPYRFYTTYRAAQESFRWAQALSVALDLSTQNVPPLPGKTLVLVDTSGSMSGGAISGRSEVQYVDVAALFGTVLAARNEGVEVVSFASDAEKINFPTKGSVLRNVDYLRGRIGKVGHSTNVGAGMQYLGDHKRLVIFSDMQDVAGLARPVYYGTSYGDKIPVGCTAYSFNLAGHEAGIVDTSKPGRYVLAGFSDAAFRMMAMVEAGKDQNWPF